MIYKELLEGSDALLALLGSAIILYTGIRAAFQIGRDVLTSNTVDMHGLRLELGNGIILGLEFMVGADIIASMVNSRCRYSCGSCAY